MNNVFINGFSILEIMAKGYVRITGAGTKSNYLRVSIPESYLVKYNLEIGKKYQWEYNNGVLYLVPVENTYDYRGVLLNKYPKQLPRISIPIAIAVAIKIKKGKSMNLFHIEVFSE